LHAVPETSARRDWIDTVARAMERLVPDAITTAIILMVVLFVLSLGLGGSVTTTMDAYIEGCGCCSRSRCR
jgi:short subunit fatty acids transporter